MGNRFRILMVFLVGCLLLAAPALARAPEAIYLVTFTGPVTSDRAAAVTDGGGEILATLSTVPVMIARMPANKAAALALRPDVVAVEPDAPVYALETIPWGVSRIGAPRAWRVTMGTAVAVAVIDTGIDYNHEDLTVVGGINTIVPGGDYMDINGHGTMVAGVIGALRNGIGVIGVAPRVDLLAVKALNDNGVGTISSIVQGIDWSVANGARVINMSFGTSMYSNALEAACLSAWNADVVLVAAAGSGLGGISYPARFATVIAVGMTDQNDQVPAFSPQGPEMEFVAPGVNVLSTLPNDNYGVMTGTSMAAPHVAGAAALVRSRWPLWTNDFVRTRLRNTAEDLGYPSTVQGFGLIRADWAVLN